MTRYILISYFVAAAMMAGGIFIGSFATPSVKMIWIIGLIIITTICAVAILIDLLIHK